MDITQILLINLVEIAVSKILERLLGWAEKGYKENNGLDWVKDLQDIHALVWTNQVRYLQITIG